VRRLLVRTRRTLVRCAVVVTALCFAGGSALATTKLPKPGTASQVAALVAGAPSIQKLPSNLVPSLSEAAQDSAGAYYGVAGRLCAGVTKCVFADTLSKTTIVLFGDSHAQMWLPALVPVATRARDRLVLIWHSGCPAAAVGVWNAYTHSVDKSCNMFRSNMISAIRKLKPAVVLIADRTSDIPGANNILTTNAAWQAGEESTIAALKGPSTKVAVIGDITAFVSQPPQCLAAYPFTIQKCSVLTPNPKTHQHFAAEKTAANAERVPYFDPQPWLCTTKCSTVIGNMVAYYDKFHVTATYAEYLSGVWATALKSLLS
jgi:hypothetical protein